MKNILKNTERPIAITIVGCFFIVAGFVGFVYHVSQLNTFDMEHTAILAIRLLAIVGGVFTLYGRNWARWLLIVWMGYHVILSFWHSTSELAIHVLIMAVVVYFLLNARTSSYFRNVK